MKIKVKDARRYLIKWEITRARTIQEAKEKIEEYERWDKIDKIYKPNQYEIFDTKTGEVIK